MADINVNLGQLQLSSTLIFTTMLEKKINLENQTVHISESFLPTFSGQKHRQSAHSLDTQTINAKVWLVLVFRACNQNHVGGN